MTTATRTMSPQPFTLSVWLLTSSLARGGVVGFASSASDNDVTFDRAIWLDELGRISFGISRGGSRSNVSTLTGYNDGAWHLVVARFSGAGQYLFVDGEPAADDPSSGGAGSYMGYWRFGEEPRDTGPETSADAAQPAGNFFAGILDEIRITADQASDAAIKLTYATQRPGATAVSYRRLP